MFIPLRVQIGVLLVLGFWTASYAAVYIHSFAGLGIALVVGWLAWKILTRKPSSATAAALSQRLASVRFMSGTQFEYFVADIMRGLGYQAQVLGGSGDQGVDVIATGRGERIAIQCKQHARRLGNKPVQEVFAGAKHHGCTKAMVVAPMGYTKGALTLAKCVGVDLHDIDSLRGWIWQIERRERGQANERNQGDLEPRTVNLDEIDRRERNEAAFEPRVVDLDETDRRERTGRSET